jgi:hypothetical protein
MILEYARDTSSNTVYIGSARALHAHYTRRYSCDTVVDTVYQESACTHTSILARYVSMCIGSVYTTLERDTCAVLCI